jgi:hypothetical protein
MLDPAVGIGGEVGIFFEYALGTDMLGDLDQQAFGADQNVKRIGRLHLGKFAHRKESLAKGRHA